MIKNISFCQAFREKNDEPESFLGEKFDRLLEPHFLHRKIVVFRLIVSNIPAKDICIQFLFTICPFLIYSAKTSSKKLSY